MKFGITRWKIVPSYRGTPCLVTWLAGFFQSFVPFANPMKLATVSGVSFSNNVQRSFPAVVSKTAVGSTEAIGLAGVADFWAGVAAFVAGAVWAASEIAARKRTKPVRKDIVIESLLCS